MRTSTKFKALYAAIAVTDTWLAGSGSPWAHRARYVTKPLLMPVLGASLATNEKAVGSPVRATTLVAQAAGWGGDVLLLGHSDKAFGAGATSFGVGHLAYIGGFLRNRDRTTAMKDNKAAVGIAGLWAVSAPAVAIAAYRRDRALGATMLGYSATLAAMVAHAQHLDPRLPRRARLLTAAGAATFMVSDSILGARTFLIPNPPDRLESAVMATYTAGQFLISEGAARA
ncbi:MAG: lysoplasmalogenase [Propionibacteriales bacterium]|nr:lysoplasmalogenase [Propionibacteriales bacterium]